jgi:hypothetical protein
VSLQCQKIEIKKLPFYASDITNFTSAVCAVVLEIPGFGEEPLFESWAATYSGDLYDTFTTVNTYSSIWQQTDDYNVNTFVYSNSANILQSNSIVNNTSGNWNSVYNSYNTASSSFLTNNSADIRYVKLSGDVMTGGLSAPSLSTNNLYVAGSTINFFDGTGSVIETLKSSDVGNFKSNYTLTNSRSANWENTYSTVSSYSATWGSGSGSGLTIFSEISSTTSPNNVVPTFGLTVNSLSSDVDFAIIPKGSGALLTGIPDGSTSGGDKRGAYATDLQRDRSDPSQVASGYGSTIGGGNSNSASGINSTIGGGYNNNVSGQSSTIGGGHQNSIDLNVDNATIGGGLGNIASGYASTIAGGKSNTAPSQYAVVGGGESNNATGDYASVAGGFFHNANGGYSTIAGGNYNNAGGNYSTIGGGSTNIATESYTTIGGGFTNQAAATGATVGGGYNNSATGDYSTIGGGLGNIASGENSFIAGGASNRTNNKANTFILGSNITAPSANYTYVNNLSSQGDIRASSVIYSASGNSNQWNTTYTTVRTNSSTNWNYQGTDIKSLTSNWQNTYIDFSSQSGNNSSVYSTVNSNSATNWNYQGTDLKNLSSNWEDTYNTVQDYSALWIIDNSIDLGVRALTSNWENTYTNFSVQSGNNINVYNTVNSNSASWVNDTPQTLTFNNINAELTISGGNTISLSSLSGGGNGSTGVSYLSALSDVSIPSPTNGQVLTYNSITNKWNAGTPLSASGATGYYGSFYDTTAQTLTSTTQAKRIDIAQTYEHNGVSIDNNRIVFNYNGVYEIIYSIQYKNTSNSQQDIYVWLKQNGNDIPNSSSVFTIPAHKNASIPAQLIAVSPFMSTLTAGDFIELYWHCNNTAVTIETFTTHANPTIPDTPGVIVTVKQVTNVQIVPTVGAYLPLSGGTLTGAVSTTNVIYTTGGNSDQWNSTYSTVQTSSGSWNAAGRYLPLSGGNLTGALVGTTATFPTATIGGLFMSGSFSGLVFNNGWWTNGSDIRFSNTGRLTFSSGSAPNNAADIILLRDAANTLALRNDTNPQTFNTYNTSTSANLTYERGFSRWNSNVFQIGTEKLGAGVARSMSLVTDGVARWNISTAGHLLAATDNTYDIGALGASRPRNGYFSGGLYTTAQSFIPRIVFQSSQFAGVIVQATNEGVLILQNYAGDSFNRIQFGGGTSTFPALKRSGATLQARLADDSAFADFSCANLSATNVVSASGGNSNQWNNAYTNASISLISSIWS